MHTWMADSSTSARPPPGRVCGAGAPGEVRMASEQPAASGAGCIAADVKRHMAARRRTVPAPAPAPAPAHGRRRHGRALRALARLWRAAVDRRRSQSGCSYCQRVRHDHGARHDIAAVCCGATRESDERQTAVQMFALQCPLCVILQTEQVETRQTTRYLGTNCPEQRRGD